jgi:hypothetical protein
MPGEQWLRFVGEDLPTLQNNKDPDTIAKFFHATGLREGEITGGRPAHKRGKE